VNEAIAVAIIAVAIIAVAIIAVAIVMGVAFPATVPFTVQPVLALFAPAPSMLTED
jgi:hypothetical protein